MNAIKEFDFTRLLNIRLLVIIVLTVITLVAMKLADINPHTDIPNELGQISGFFGGLIDGLFSPISMFQSRFCIDDSVYNEYNTGFWYSFGFLLPMALYGYVLVIAWIFSDVT